MDNNRRESNRIPARGCRVDFSHRGKFFFSKVISFDNIMIDMSPGGLRFTHPKPLRVGMSLGLTIHPPHTFLPLRLRGRVAWVEVGKKNGGKGEYSTGIEFRRMRARENKQLRQVLDSLAGYFGLPRVAEPIRGGRLR